MEVASVTPRLVGTLLKALLVTLLAAFLAPSTTWAATISTGIDHYGNHYLTLEGPIVEGDPERFVAAIFEANARGYRLDALHLNSPGGQVWETLAMALMVRWVENMATVVQKDAKCESACFGLFAAGYRKYVDPVADPTQIGVHSIYALIKQQGGATGFFLKEKEEMTIWAVRRLKALGTPASIVDKIVTTPPDQMTYLSIEDLQQMGVEVTGYPGGAKSGILGPDRIYLSPAVVRANIALDHGAIIPAGTVVVTTNSKKWEACSPLEHPPNEATRMCNVSYHLPGKDIISTAQVPEASLLRIQQGWNSEPPQPTQPQQTQPPQQQPQPPSIAEPQPPKKLWAKEYAGVATTDLMFRVAPDPKADFVQPEPNAFIPKGTEVALYADCEVWRGSGRGEQDADNVWCPVIYGNQKGWANGLYLQMRDGRHMACIMYPKAYPCPGTFEPQGGGVVATVTENLMLRRDPDRLSQSVLEGLYPDHIPAGQHFSFNNFSQASQACTRIDSGKIWCPLTYKTSDGQMRKGWVNAYYLALNDGTPLACELDGSTSQIPECHIYLKAHPGFK